MSKNSCVIRKSTPGVDLRLEVAQVVLGRSWRGCASRGTPPHRSRSGSPRGSARPARASTPGRPRSWSTRACPAGGSPRSASTLSKPCVAHLVERRRAARRRRADAGEVRHRLEAELVADPRDDLDRLPASSSRRRRRSPRRTRDRGRAAGRAPRRGSARPRASSAGRTRTRRRGRRSRAGSRRCACPQTRTTPAASDRARRPRRCARRAPWPRDAPGSRASRTATSWRSRA